MVICGLFDIFKNIKKVGDTANSIKKDGLAGFSKNSLKLALHNLAKMAGAAFKHAVFSVVSIILPYAVPIIAIVVSLVIVASIFASLFNFWNSNNNEGTGTGTLTGATVQEKVWIALTEAGYSEYATAGVMGNMQAESDFDPAAGEAGYSIESGGIGLVQWTNDGRGGSGGNTNLRKYAESIGKSWTDEDVQIEFLLADLAGGGCNGYSRRELYNSTKGYYGKKYYIDDWLNATSAETAAEVFAAVYERPSAKAFHSSLSKRKSYAGKYYNEFHGKTRADFSSGSNGIIKGDVNTDGYTQKININGVQYTEYKQNSPKWKNVSYWGSTIGHSGCGPTSLAVIASGFGKSYTPETVVKSYMTPPTDGTNLKNALQKMNISATYCSVTSSSKNDIKNHLATGKPVVVSITGKPFSSGKHIMAVLGINGNNVYVSNVYNSPHHQTGWVSIDTLISAMAGKYYVKVTSQPKITAISGTPTPTATTSSKAMNNMITEAKRIANDDRYIYVYGAMDFKGKKFDCSGFVKYLYQTYLNISLPRSSSEYTKYKGTKKQVSLKSLQPGDILWRSGHVGMYIGNDTMVHAANPRTGIVVVSFSKNQKSDPFTTAYRFYNN